MAVLFFDSSGLVKRYIAETGTAWVQSITAASAGNDRFIAKITGPEITADFARDFFLLEVSLPCAQEAMTLSARHGLRGYDAVQLAAALFLRD